MKKILLILTVASALISCEIVSLEEPDTDITNGAAPQIETPDILAIDLGSETFPEDSTTRALFLHGQNSKTWTTEAFIIEGAGFTRSLSCRIDDVITFHSDGTFDYESGDWSCFGEEGDDAIDRTGNHKFFVPENGKLHLDFNNVTGFDDSEFEGKVWTLEENAIVISTDYQSSVFGTFTVTGRYVSK